MTTQTSVDAADEIGRALDSFARGAIDFQSLNARIDVVLGEHPDARATALRLIDEQRPTGALQRAFFRVLKERIGDGHGSSQGSDEDAADTPCAAPDDEAEPRPTPAFRVRSDDASIPPETHFDTGLPFAATLRESTRRLFARDDVSRDDGARKAYGDAAPAPARFPFEVVEPPQPAEPVVAEAAAESAAEAFDAAARDDVPESAAEVTAPPPEEASPASGIRPPHLEAADMPGEAPDAGAAVAADADSDVAPEIEAPAAPAEPRRQETVLRAPPARRPVSRRARRGPPRARVPDPTVPFEDSPLDLSFPFSDPPEERFVARRRVGPVRPAFDEAPPVAPAGADAPPPGARRGPEDPGDIVPERREVRRGRRRESVPVMLAVIVAAIAAWFFKDPVGGRLAEEGEVAVPLATPAGDAGTTAAGDVAAPLPAADDTGTSVPASEPVRDDADMTAEAVTPAAPPVATVPSDADPGAAAAPPATGEDAGAGPPPEAARTPTRAASEPSAAAATQPPASPATTGPRRPGPALPGDRRASGAPPPTPRASQTETTAPPAPVRTTTAAAPAARDVPARASARFRIAGQSFTVREDQTMVAITLVRSGALNAPATITWWVNPGTARPDEDYADLGRRAEAFGPGETRRTIYVPITSDTLPEPEETFEVEIGEPQIGASFDGVTSATVTIVDDD